MTKEYNDKFMEVSNVFLFCSILTWFAAAAADTIVASQSIRDGIKVASARGEFEMGFFSPGTSKNRYFGIWYKKISSGTVVWVANRDAPLANNRSGAVRVSHKGIEVVKVSSTNRSDTILWSSNQPSTYVKNPVAQLLDTGNLVFREEGEDERFAWQSFDYPVDNFLPGMKFGVDLVTGIDRHFTPWTSADDPSPGNYVHRLDHNGYPQLLLWRGSDVWYRTGPWVGSTFSGIPRLKTNPIYTPRFVITPGKEVYYTFDLVNSSASAITRIALFPNGDSRRLIWNERNQEWKVYLTLQVSDCDRYGLCGAYGACNMNNSPRCECLRGFVPKSPANWAEADWSDGCVPHTELECGKGEGFRMYSGVKLPDTRHSWYSTSMNLVDCKNKCLNNCSCTAYSNIDIRTGSGCLLWFGDLTDIRGFSEDGQDLYVKMASSELGGHNKSTAKKRLGIILPLILVAAILVGLFMLYASKKRKLKRRGTLQFNLESDASKGREAEEFDLPLIDFIKIANATNNFSHTNKLGEGGFGPVYKGTMEGGQEIAVKRLSNSSRQGVEEFKNEVQCIAKLQHRNLVKLLGCCIEEGERMLIYEYMPNKSLDLFIFDEKVRNTLNWPKRYNIISGIARGILYLHQDSRLRIIHRDLKASNILLDYEMNPKISDFGMARSFGGSETEANTTRVVGTYGYMPPEYAIDGLFSVKSDVYSFGVLLLEIVSGKKNRGYRHADHNLNLLGHAWRSYKEDNLVEVIDEVILKSSSLDEVFRVIHIGLLCVQEYPEDRPSMSSVVLMLSSIVPLPPSKQPGFFSERKPHETDSSSSCNPLSSSINQYSVSFFAPR